MSKSRNIIDYFYVHLCKIAVMVMDQTVDIGKLNKYFIIVSLSAETVLVDLL